MVSITEQPAGFWSVMATTHVDKNGFNHLATDGLKGSWPQPGNQMPNIALEKFLAEFLVTGEKQPILWQHYAGGPALSAKLQTSVEEDGGQVILGFRVVPLTEVPQPVALLASG